MIINKKAVKANALGFSRESHDQQFTRVSPEFLDRFNRGAMELLKAYVNDLPRTGKTIK